jgi:hypothetical protein
MGKWIEYMELIEGKDYMCNDSSTMPCVTQ